MLKKTSILLILLFVLVGCNKKGAETDLQPEKEAEKQVQVQQKPMPRGMADDNLIVELYQESRCFNGTTLLADLHDKDNPRIIEINMLGEIVWEYSIPEDLNQFTEPGLDVELLANNNILYVLPKKGIYEITRDREIVWSYEDEKVSNDADRLPNGNTLFVWGADAKEDEQVREINSNKEIVWSWKAKDSYNKEPYKDIYNNGWTGANAVTRLSNGNTLVSLGNFNLTAEVNKQGEVVWEYDWTEYGENVNPHDPEYKEGGLLVALQNDSKFQAVRINKDNGQPVWQFGFPGFRSVRDANLLPNGNVLLVGVLTKEEESAIIEVTQQNEVVWFLRLAGISAEDTQGYFYKAERLIIN